MCSFVATAGTIYTIILQYNNNPSTTGYWYDDGTPLVTYISI